MNYDVCIKKIDRFLQKNDSQPLLVDVQNRNDLTRLLTHYCVGTTESVVVSNYCKKDEFPRIDNLFNDIQNKSNICFVTGLTSYLKLNGEQELTSRLRETLGMSTLGHVIIISYQCKRYLNIHDPRIIRRIAVLDGEESAVPDIYFCSPELPLPKGVVPTIGLENFALAVESSTNRTIYVVTAKTKKQFPYALYNITELSRVYDILALEDSRTKELDKEMGTEQQWQYALSLFNETPGWGNAIDNVIGDHLRLEIYISVMVKHFCNATV